MDCRSSRASAKTTKVCERWIGTFWWRLAYCILDSCVRRLVFTTDVVPLAEIADDPSLLELAPQQGRSDGTEPNIAIIVKEFEK